MTASRIPTWVRVMVCNMFHGYCGIEGCTCRGEEIHHKLSNSKSNVAAFPLFINSVFNLVLICRKHHLDGKALRSVRVTARQAMIFEEFLEKLIGKGKV